MIILPLSSGIIKNFVVVDSVRTISLTIKKRMLIKQTTYISWIRRNQKESNFLNVLHIPIFLKVSKAIDLDWGLFKSMYKFCICPSLCLTLLCRPLCLLVCLHMYTCLCVCVHFSISTSTAVIFLFFYSQNDSNCILCVLFFRGRWLTKHKMLMSKEREDLWVKSFFFLNLGKN